MSQGVFYLTQMDRIDKYEHKEDYIKMAVTTVKPPGKGFCCHHLRLLEWDVLRKGAGLNCETNMPKQLGTHKPLNLS